MNNFTLKPIIKEDFKNTIKLVLQDALYDDLIFEFGEEQIVNFLDAVIYNSVNKIRDKINKGSSLDDGTRYAHGYIACEYCDHINNSRVEMVLTSVIVKVLRCYKNQYIEAERLAYVLGVSYTTLAPNFSMEYGIYTNK